MCIIRHAIYAAEASIHGCTYLKKSTLAMRVKKGSTVSR